MDAVEFFKQRARMCGSFDNCCECGLYRRNPGNSALCEDYCFEEPEKAVQVVEKWAAEHPVKTRLSEYRRLFPNANMDEYPLGCVKAYNMGVNCENFKDCEECKRAYWMQEVDENADV
mgnify:CR=1 FL=1